MSNTKKTKNLIEIEKECQSILAMFEAASAKLNLLAAYLDELKTENTQLKLR